MAEKQTGMRMATATKADIQNLYMLYNVLENVCKYDAKSLADFDHFEEDELKHIKDFITTDDEIDYEALVNYLHGLTNGYHRVVMGFKVLFDNVADKNLDYLDYKPELKQMIQVLNKAAAHLQESPTNYIVPGSQLAQEIIAAAADDEEQEVANG